MPNKYDAIIHLPHHVSTKHPQMPLADRAAQFAPFAALSGYGAIIREAGRLTERKIELDEYALFALNEKLGEIREQLKNQPTVKLTYFKPDDKKPGGAYLTITGSVRKIDEYKRQVVLTDGEKIPFEDIIAIE